MAGTVPEHWDRLAERLVGVPHERLNELAYRWMDRGIRVFFAEALENEGMIDDAKAARCLAPISDAASIAPAAALVRGLVGTLMKKRSPGAGSVALGLSVVLDGSWGSAGRIDLEDVCMNVTINARMVNFVCGRGHDADDEEARQLADVEGVVAATKARK